MKIAMLGTGLIGTFYTMSLHGLRSRDEVVVVYSRSESRGAKFARENNISNFTTSLQEAVSHPKIDAVVVGLPNDLHKEAIFAAADAGKAVLCTKPLARNAEEAWQILEPALNGDPRDK